MKNNQIGILGYGEVGQAIAKFYQSPKIKDLKRDDGLAGVEILHVCLPWNNKFVSIVKKEIKKIKPKLVIVHSTVAPGTVKKISNDLPRACRGVVHSPIRGIHPHLYKGIKTFVKYIGADNKKAGEAAEKHLKSLGIKTKVFYPSITTELAKLLDTTYYGLVIAWHGEMKKFCDKYKIDFDQAVTDFNQTYNEGYIKLGKKNVVRPVLYPPMNGFGGHCLLENAILLREANPLASLVSDFLLQAGKDEKSIPEEKPYFNKAWLYAEYWGKGRSTSDIGKQFGVSGENIGAIMERRGIPVRDRRWTHKQLTLIKKLAEKGKNFREIAEEMERAGKTYNGIRNAAYKLLGIKSPYDPAVIDEETRQKISASLQGIEWEDWEEFKEDINSLIRKSVVYQKWREKIFKRDSYTCQKCGAKNGLGKAVYLVAHHTESFSSNPKIRMNVKNGITLCKECHLDFHNRYGREKNNRKQLKEYLG